MEGNDENNLTSDTNMSCRVMQNLQILTVWWICVIERCWRFKKFLIFKWENWKMLKN